jgi:hypothetical protein
MEYGDGKKGKTANILFNAVLFSSFVYEVIKVITACHSLPAK